MTYSDASWEVLSYKVVGRWDAFAGEAGSDARAGMRCAGHVVTVAI